MPKRKNHEFLSHAQDVQLCELVESFPCLYDPNYPEYKDISVRDRAWEEIGAKMNLPVNACKFRWRNIRDCYKRAMRLLMYGGQDANMRPRKQYVLINHLTFLEKIIDIDDKRSSSLLPQGEVIDGGQMIPNIEIILDAAKADNFCPELKQEQEDCEEEANNESEEEEHADNEEREETDETHFTNMDPTGALRVTNVSSTCNVYPAEHPNNDMRYSTRNLRSTNAPNRISVGKGRFLKRQKVVDLNYSQTRPKRRKAPEDFLAFGVEDHTQPAAPSRYEDDTELFFHSMALSAKSLHPVLLAELKKKICVSVMDSVIENEKLSANLQSQTCFLTKESSAVELTNQRKEQDQEIQS